MKIIWTFFLAGAMLWATPIPSVGTQVELTSPGDPTNIIVGNIYISPYAMLINGQTYPAMCIDFTDESYLNTPWQAYITPIADGNFTNTYHSADAHVATEYKEEAYLYSRMISLSLSDPDYNTDRIDIQEADWEITDSSYTPTDPTGAQTWLTLAQNNYASVNLAGYDIVSDVNNGNGRNQEFIVATPEPESLTLLGAGLLLIGLGASRKKFAKAKAV